MNEPAMFQQRIIKSVTIHQFWRYFKYAVKSTVVKAVLKEAKDAEFTTSSGRLFQILTTRSEKKFFLISNRARLWYNLNL